MLLCEKSQGKSKYLQCAIIFMFFYKEMLAYA